MKSFKQYILTEATYDLDDDVNYIYDKALDTFYKQLMIQHIDTPSVPDITFPSSELPSEKARESSLINPILISIADHSLEDWLGAYDPDKKTLYINVPMDLILVKWKNLTANEFVYNAVERRFRKGFLNIFNGKDVKGVIYHELAHWIDDTLYGNLARSVELMNKYYDEFNYKMGDEVFKRILDPSRYHEINGQIHHIKSLKKSFAKKWDKFTLDDVISLSAALIQTQDTIGAESKLKRIAWRKAILSRMAREGLLGKNMNRSKGKV